DNNSSRRFKNRVKIHPLDHAMKPYSEHRCRPNQSPEPSVIAFDREIGNFDRSIRVTIAVGHKGLLPVYSKRVAEFALATAILALSAAVCMAAKEAAARLEDGQVR